MITGIMVYDEKHEMTSAQLVEYGRKVFKRRLKIEPTHAVIHAGSEFPEVDGMIITQQKYVRPWHALVGIPVVAEAADRPMKTEEF